MVELNIPLDHPHPSYITIRGKSQMIAVNINSRIIYAAIQQHAFGDWPKDLHSCHILGIDDYRLVVFSPSYDVNALVNK